MEIAFIKIFFLPSNKKIKPSLTFHNVATVNP